jgi:Ssp1 endopeptidase immunity protein Rap1a
MTFLTGDYRMKTFFALALLASGVVVSGAATQTAWAAQPIALHARTANELAELCGANPREPAAEAKVNYCDGFAQAAVDLELQHSADKKPFCFPSPAPSRRATLGEFANWVRAMPEHRSLTATDGLFKFLAERFPCK